MAPKPRGKREKLPFWKRLGPEFKHISDHIGNVINNSTVKDWAELAAVIGCAIGGYSAWNPLGLGKEGALTGVIGYKLATTDGGTPPISQIAGLGILGSTVLVGNAWRIKWNEMTDEQKTEAVETITGQKGVYGPAGLLTIPYSPEDFVWASFGVLGTVLKSFIEAQTGG